MKNKRKGLPYSLYMRDMCKNHKFNEVSASVVDISGAITGDSTENSEKNTLIPLAVQEDILQRYNLFVRHLKVFDKDYGSHN